MRPSDLSPEDKEVIETVMEESVDPPPSRFIDQYLKTLYSTNQRIYNIDSKSSPLLGRMRKK